MSDLPAGIDSSRPHAARIYDYFLGGTNNFAADRTAAAEVPRPAPAEVNCYGGVARKT